MPTVIDKTVVAQAYDTSGNGGRKLVHLDNGWKVSVVKDATSKTAVNFYVSKDNTMNFIPLTKFTPHASTSPTVFDVSITSIGVRVYVIISALIGSTATVYYANFDATTVPTDMVYNTHATQLDINQTGIGSGNSIITNEAKTELHAAWSSKNATYANSFNIRYVKGVIQADGSVVLGAVEQVTVRTVVDSHVTDPSLVLDKNGNVRIFVGWIANTSNRYISVLAKENTGITSDATLSMNTGWVGKSVYTGGSYSQSSPSAIFVPQSINGLANGRIWVAWRGNDSVTPGADNIRVSYSDDAGGTWSAMQSLTTGNLGQYAPSITANKNNEVSILWSGYISSTVAEVRSIKHNGTSWETVKNVTAKNNGDVAKYPSTLFDLSVNYTEPLFIYRDTAKVGFYGTWTVINISVPTGSIGNKDNPVLLPYNITTDGTMSTITEKVNGVVVGTKTATSGQQLAVSLTKEQWDAIRYGKYADYSELKGTVSSEWEQGDYNLSIGAKPSPRVATNRIRKKIFNNVFPNRTYTIQINPLYEIYIVELDSVGNAINFSGYKLNGSSITTLSATSSLLFLIRKSDDSVINETIIPVVNPKLSSYTNNNNTLTIEMGSNKWEYTFDKALAPTDDLTSIAKSVKDTNEVLLPSVKSGLISTIRGKGGVVTGDKWEDIKKGISGIPPGNRKTSGTLISSNVSPPILSETGSLSNYRYYIALDMSLLGFTPSLVDVRATAKNDRVVTTWRKDDFYYLNSTNFANVTHREYYFRIPYVNGLVNLPVEFQNFSYTWTAYE